MFRPIFNVNLFGINLFYYQKIKNDQKARENNFQKHK